MISNNSIKNFFRINIILIMFAIIHYKLLLVINNFYSYTFILFLIRNITMERIMNYILKNKNNIGNHERNITKINSCKFIFYFLTSTIVETTTYIFISKFYVYKQDNIIWDLIYFIPISFIYEIVFDFFHYITHRLEHKNKYLYKYIHKVHHLDSYPSTLTTYIQHPIDLILTNTIPQILTLIIIPKISFLTMNIIIIYKIFLEICGHSGKVFSASCFPQLIWLPRVLNIELYTEDHDAHHTLNNCNYSKRFSLWDKIFGTYTKLYNK